MSIEIPQPKCQVKGSTVLNLGFLEGGSVYSCVLCMHEILEATPTFGKNYAHFERF